LKYCHSFAVTGPFCTLVMNGSNPILERALVKTIVKGYIHAEEYI